MENEDVSVDLSVNEPSTVYHNRTGGGQNTENSDGPADADDTESSHLVSTDIHESLHDPISVQGGSLDHSSHTHSELQRHDEGGLQSPPSGRDPTSPPPDYNEIVVTEFYAMKGLICRDVQTEPMVCSCMCHAEAAGNRGHCSESARSTGYSPFVCDRQTIPTAPFIPDRQTIPTGSYNPGIGYSTGPVFIHDAVHGAQITPPYQVTNTRNFTIDQKFKVKQTTIPADDILLSRKLAKRLVILLFVFIVFGAIICVAVIAGR